MTASENIVDFREGFVDCTRMGRPAVTEDEADRVRGFQVVVHVKGVGQTHHYRKSVGRSHLDRRKRRILPGIDHRRSHVGVAHERRVRYPEVLVFLVYHVRSTQKKHFINKIGFLTEKSYPSRHHCSAPNSKTWPCPFRTCW